MTVDGKLFEVLEKKFSERKWIWKAQNQRQFGFNSYNGADPNVPVAVVLDGLTVLYSAADNLIQLINRLENILIKVLQEPGVKHLCVAMDADTPPPKDVNGKNLAGVVRTPFTVEQPRDPLAAWEAFYRVSVNPVDVSVALASLVNSTDPKSAYNMPLQRDFELQLSNRDYKAFISHMLCRGIFASLKVPDDVTFLVRGPGIDAQRTGCITTVIPPGLAVKFWEADYFCTTYTNHFHETHRVVVLSEDGDTTLSLLMGQSQRMSKRSNILSEVKFYNRVYHVRTWKSIYGSGTPAEQGIGPPKFVTYIDIQNLWMSIQLYALNLRRVSLHKFLWQPVVPSVVMVCLMLKNDYVAGLPNIGPVTLFNAFEKFIQQTNMPLLANTTSHTNLRLDFEQLIQLVIMCYRKRQSNLNVDYESVGEALDNIRVAQKSNAECLTQDGIAVYFANIRWFMSYMIAAQTGQLPESGLETRDGLSVHGYADLSVRGKDNLQLLPFGRRDIKRPVAVNPLNLRINKP